METTFGEFSIKGFPTIKLNANVIAMVGGGTNPISGEISLAHNGVLFLDEID